MHCYICDREDDLIIYDKLTGSYSPCTTCQEAINECLEAFEEDDDALPSNGEQSDVEAFGDESSTEAQPSISTASFAPYLVTSVLPRASF